MPLFGRKRKKKVESTDELVDALEPIDEIAETPEGGDDAESPAEAEPDAIGTDSGETDSGETTESAEGSDEAEASETPPVPDAPADAGVFQDRRELDGRINSPMAKLLRGVQGLFTRKYTLRLVIIVGAIVLLAGGGLFIYSRIMSGRIEENLTAGYDSATQTDLPGVYYLRAGKTDGVNSYRLQRLEAGTNQTALHFDSKTPLEQYAAAGGIKLINDKDIYIPLSCEYAPGSLTNMNGDKMLIFGAIPEDTKSLRLSFVDTEGAEKIGFGILFDEFKRSDSFYFSGEPGLVGFWDYQDIPIELKRMDINGGLTRVTLETSWNERDTDYVLVEPEDIMLKWKDGSTRALDGGVKQFLHEDSSLQVGVYDFPAINSIDGLSVEIARLFRYQSFGVEYGANELYDGVKSVEQTLYMGRDISVVFEGIRKQGTKYIAVCHAELIGGEDAGETNRAELSPDTRLLIRFSDGSTAEIKGEYQSITAGCDIVFDVQAYEEKFGASDPYAIATLVIDGIGVNLSGGSVPVDKSSFLPEKPLGYMAGIKRVEGMLKAEAPGDAYEFSVLDMAAKGGKLYASIAESYIGRDGQRVYDSRSVAVQ